MAVARHRRPGRTPACARRVVAAPGVPLVVACHPRNRLLRWGHFARLHHPRVPLLQLHPWRPPPSRHVHPLRRHFLDYALGLPPVASPGVAAHEGSFGRERWSLPGLSGPPRCGARRNGTRPRRTRLYQHVGPSGTCRAPGGRGRHKGILGPPGRPGRPGREDRVCRPAHHSPGARADSAVPRLIRQPGVGDRRGRRICHEASSSADRLGAVPPRRGPPDRVCLLADHRRPRLAPYLRGLALDRLPPFRRMDAPELRRRCEPGGEAALGAASRPANQRNRVRGPLAVEAGGQHLSTAWSTPLCSRHSACC